MRQHIWGDPMAQYLPGEEPEPEPLEDPHPIPALAALDHLVPRDHPDYFHIALSIQHLLKLGFDPMEAETIEMAKVLTKVRDAERSHYASMWYRNAAKALDEGPSGVVYYMKMRDLIKIGYTSRPVEQRRRQLMADSVLATEPGTLKLETVRHNQFREYKHEGERFYPGRKLMLHIATLRGNRDRAAG